MAQRRKNFSRAQIGKKAQRAADGQKALFGAVIAGLVVPLGAADGAEQHCVGRLTGCLRLFRERHTGGVDGAAAEQLIIIRKRKAELFTGFVQHFQRLVHDFRADAVAL